MKYIFEEVHQFSREGRCQDIIDTLLSENGTTIKSPYDIDLNHAWYLVGDAYYRQGKFQFAISAFKRAIEDWPEDKEAILALSNSYSESSLPEKSEQTLRDGLKKWPNNEQYIYNLANALFDQRKYQEAISLYKSLGDKSEFAVQAKINVKLARNMMKRK